MSNVRVVLADDHTIVREGLRTMLALTKDIQVVGEAGDGPEAVRLARDLKPHVVVMDVAMPGLNGIEATRKILEADPQIRVVGLSMHSDRRFVVGMLAAGAKGYLLKNCASEELVQAIREVAADRVYFGSRIQSIVAEDYVRQIQGRKIPSLFVLTERERDVVRLLALGHNTKAIAASLGLSPKTIEAHRQHAMEKLGLQSLADLTRFALREGLISLDG